MFDPYTILSNVALFAELSEEELQALAHRAAKQHVHAGEILFNEEIPVRDSSSSNRAK